MCVYICACMCTCVRACAYVLKKYKIMSNKLNKCKFFTLHQNRHHRYFRISTVKTFLQALCELNSLIVELQ